MTRLTTLLIQLAWPTMPSFFGARGDFLEASLATQQPRSSLSSEGAHTAKAWMNWSLPAVRSMWESAAWTHGQTLREEASGQGLVKAWMAEDHTSTASNSFVDGLVGGLSAVLI